MIFFSQQCTKVDNPSSVPENISFGTEKKDFLLLKFATTILLSLSSYRGTQTRLAVMMEYQYLKHYKFLT